MASSTSGLDSRSRVSKRPCLCLCAGGLNTWDFPPGKKWKNVENEIINHHRSMASSSISCSNIPFPLLGYRWVSLYSCINQDYWQTSYIRWIDWIVCKLQVAASQLHRFLQNRPSKSKGWWWLAFSFRCFFFLQTSVTEARRNLMASAETLGVAGKTSQQKTAVSCVKLWAPKGRQGQVGLINCLKVATKPKKDVP